MPTLATHRNPHLDDITALWLLQRFHPHYKKSGWKFFPANATGVAPRDKNLTLVGIGRGQFDEHKGDVDDCATSLVYKFLLQTPTVRWDETTKKALAELVRYVNAEDHAANLASPHVEFSFAAALLAMAASKRPAAEMVRFGYQYLDAVLEWLRAKQLLAADWRQAKKIKTRWGAGLAIETVVSSRVVMRQAALQKMALVIVVNPRTKFRSLRARADSKVDLTAAYKIVKKIEPKAEWYLHHSKKMLICGSDVAANVYLSKLPLAALIKLVV